MKSGFVVLVAGICVVGGKKGGLCMLLTNLCSPQSPDSILFGAFDRDLWDLELGWSQSQWVCRGNKVSQHRCVAL
jgi:hypothetical protein